MKLTSRQGRAQQAAPLQELLVAEIFITLPPAAEKHAGQPQKHADRVGAGADAGRSVDDGGILSPAYLVGGWPREYSWRFYLAVRHRGEYIIQHYPM